MGRQPGAAQASREAITGFLFLLLGDHISLWTGAVLCPTRVSLRGQQGPNEQDRTDMKLASESRPP